MPKGRKLITQGEVHYTFTCPCIKGLMKEFATETQRNYYSKLHNKKCKQPKAKVSSLEGKYTSKSGHISQMVVF